MESDVNMQCVIEVQGTVGTKGGEPAPVQEWVVFGLNHVPPKFICCSPTSDVTVIGERAFKDVRLNKV